MEGPKIQKLLSPEDWKLQQYQFGAEVSEMP